MSLLTSIENAAHTAAAWFLKVLKKSQAAAPTISAVADRTLPWAKLVVDGVLTAEGSGAVAPEANAIIDEINRDLDVACAAVYDVGVTPTVASSIQAVAGNIDGLIAAGHVKNPGNVALIKNVVSSLLSLVGGTSSAPATA